jgi:hypothetical protein
MERMKLIQIQMNKFIGTNNNNNQMRGPNNNQMVMILI